MLFAPDGRFAYVSVRDATDGKRDAIAIFRVTTSAHPAASAASAASLLEDESAIALIGSVPTGHYPRSIAIDPTGRLILAANQKGGTLSSFWRDATTGMLSPAKQPPVALPDSPAFVMVL